MLVKGAAIDVVTRNKTGAYYYAEPFIVPASAEHYLVRVKGDKMAFLVVAYVKGECC